MYIIRVQADEIHTHVKVGIFQADEAEMDIDSLGAIDIFCEITSDDNLISHNRRVFISC